MSLITADAPMTLMHLMMGSLQNPRLFFLQGQIGSTCINILSCMRYRQWPDSQVNTVASDDSSFLDLSCSSLFGLQTHSQMISHIPNRYRIKQAQGIFPQYPGIVLLQQSSVFSEIFLIAIQQYTRWIWVARKTSFNTMVTA